MSTVQHLSRRSGKKTKDNRSRLARKCNALPETDVNWRDRAGGKAGIRAASLALQIPNGNYRLTYGKYRERTRAACALMTGK